VLLNSLSVSGLFSVKGADCGLLKMQTKTVETLLILNAIERALLLDGRMHLHFFWQDILMSLCVNFTRCTYMRDEGRRKHRIDTFATINEAYNSLYILLRPAASF